MPSVSGEHCALVGSRVEKTMIKGFRDWEIRGFRGRQKAEVGNQKSENGGKTAEVGNQIELRLW